MYPLFWASFLRLSESAAQVPAFHGVVPVMAITFAGKTRETRGAEGDNLFVRGLPLRIGGCLSACLPPKYYKSTLSENYQQLANSTTACPLTPIIDRKPKSFRTLEIVVACLMIGAYLKTGVYLMVEA